MRLLPARTQAFIRARRLWVHEHVIRRPVTAAIISFGGLAFGAILSVWPKEIAEATRIAVIGPTRGALHGWVALFWIAIVFWTIFLYYRLKSDDATETQRFTQLTAAIHRSPDYKIFPDYPDFYDRAAEAIASTHTPNELDDVRIRNLLVGIRLVLDIIATLAAKFSRAPQTTAFGANVMLVAKPPFTAELVEGLRFFPKNQHDPNTSLVAALYLPKALLLADVEAENAEGSRREVPLIALPVPKGGASDSRGHRLALPGAPWAFLTGTQSAQLDTRQMADECVGVLPATIEEVREYFSADGEGRHVRSFVSFRIGNGRNPVGVLNIDCDQPEVLGPEAEYYPTFYALVTPIVRLLSKPLIEYAGLTSARGEFFGK